MYFILIKLDLYFIQNLLKHIVLLVTFIAEEKVKGLESKIIGPLASSAGSFVNLKLPPICFHVLIERL